MRRSVSILAAMATMGDTHVEPPPVLWRHVSRETLNDLPGDNEACRAKRRERRARRKARMRLRKLRGWR